MSENFEKQPNTPSRPDQPENWDMDNLHDFFKLLLDVDRRINPKRYKAKKND